MKTSLPFGFVILALLGAAQVFALDSEAPQIVVQCKFVELSIGSSGSALLPPPLDRPRVVPGLAGVFTDPQFQATIRALSQRKGVDLLSAPSVTTRSGQHAKVEVVRDFGYKNRAGEPDAKKVGVTFDVLPRLAANGKVSLDMNPQVVEFDGFIKHQGGWQEARFTERKAPTKVAVTPGHTVVMELLPRTDKQIVEDEDESGHIISRKTNSFIRRTLVFVTPQVVEPTSGKTVSSN